MKALRIPTVTAETEEAWAPGEEWREVPGYEGRYRVSESGVVMSLHGLKPRRLTTLIDDKGYPRASLKLDGRHQNRRLHKLVASAFLGPLPPGLMVRHLDGNQFNNHFSNLAFGTASDNMQDKIRHGRNHELAKTHCPNGHSYSPENTIVTSRGSRRCRACRKEQNHNYYIKANAPR